MTEKEKELLGTIEGLTNWLGIVLELIQNTSCDPEDIDEFNETLMCGELQMTSGEKILKKYEYRKEVKI